MASANTSLSPDPQVIRAVYDRQASAYDKARSRTLFEGAWLERFVAGLPAGGHVLDLGCGAGEPVAAWLIGQGLRVTGLDISPKLLAIAQDRWPDGDWRLGDMQALPDDVPFDGIIAWGSFFHLAPDAQRACLPRLAAALKPGGALLLTVGHKAGTTTGKVGTEHVYHASLSPAEYTTLLETHGLHLRAFVAQDETCNDHTVLLARRPFQGEHP